ncbi:hypothetical protein HPG69_012933 [Diceros bicornis minor]|uniref:Uncharacterized protein n=1 Tax=Diceros bicornis minor TaxID=77932 RepID=A0A7J7F144_DICBM|nr:hypothetical protein HPG69_012933 [Diceros bicornis minor]
MPEVHILEAEMAALSLACEELLAPWEETSRVQKSNYSKKIEDLASTEMTEKNIMKVLQRHRLSGNCHMVTFQLGFQILEIQNEESLSFVTSDLNIIMELTEYSELKVYTFFEEWCEYCKHMFKHFEVPVYAHEGDKEHAAEEANVIKARDHLAHYSPKHPLVQLIVGLKGEGEDKKQVRQGQVQEVYVCDGPQLLAGDKDQDDQAVSQETEYKQEAVKDGKKRLTISLDKFPIAGA